MRKLLKAILDIFRSDPRKIGVTGELEQEEKPFYKNKKTIRTGGIIIAAVGILLRFLLRPGKKEKPSYEEEDED